MITQNFLAFLCEWDSRARDLR